MKRNLMAAVAMMLGAVGSVDTLPKHEEKPRPKEGGSLHREKLARQQAKLERRARRAGYKRKD